MKPSRLRFVIFALLAASLACSQFTVVNQSQRPVSVQVTLPDGSGGAMLLGPDGYHDWFVLEGGPYEVSVIPSEGLINFMREVQTSTLTALLTGEVEPAYANFVGPEADPFTALQAYISIEGGIQGALEGVTCTGELPYIDLEAMGFDITLEGPDTVTVALNVENGINWVCDN